MARHATRALMILTLVVGAHASAHATFVFGQVEVAPNPIAAGESFTLTITLEDPSLAPVEAAIVFVELRPMDALAGANLPPPSTDAPSLPAPERNLRLIEVAPAVYQTSTTLAHAGAYHLLVRDQTFPWEEANASVVLAVGEPVPGLPFILPPTQVAPRSVWTWVFWLLGIPLVAGLIVTLLVLRSAPRTGRAP